MSANATFTEPWTGTLTQLEWPSNPRLLLLALINIPLISIVLNVLWQLVRGPVLWVCEDADSQRSYPATSRNPRSSGIGFLSLDLLLPTAATRLRSSGSAGRRCAQPGYFCTQHLTHTTSAVRQCFHFHPPGQARHRHVGGLKATTSFWAASTPSLLRSLYTAYVLSITVINIVGVI